jgi:hypothetical protein
MSRRRGEFEHRTSLFEGAYRAWSYLGDLEPDDVFHKLVSDLDPLTNIPSGKKEWRYEALPRTGLEHPYVRAILKAWLGTDADDAAEVEQGLSTLRNWWQHRRKGESRSAVNALGTEKMRGIVDGYTRHFFTLAVGLVRSDKAMPPKTLLSRMGGKYKQPVKKPSTAPKPKKPKKDRSIDEEEVGEIMTAMATVKAAAAAATAPSIPTPSSTVTPRDSFRASLSSVDSVTAAAAATVAAITAGEGLGSRSSLTIPSGLDTLKRQSFTLPASSIYGGGLCGGLGLENNPTLEQLLQQQRQQQQAAFNALDLSQFAGQHHHLLGAGSVLTPLERLHLAQRQRQLSLVSAGSLLGAPAPSASFMAQIQPTLGVYTPPSWLLHPGLGEQP